MTNGPARRRIGDRSLNRETSVVAWCAALVIATQASCVSTFRNPFRAAGPPAPDVLAPGAVLGDVITMVNRNADRLQSYQTNNASISVPGMSSIPLLSGKIAAQRPGRLRLLASTALTGPEVDLGSNDELYWFWVKRNEPPAVYYARRQQATSSAAAQLTPIEPQWLLDALGFMRFNAEDAHEGPLPVGDRAVEIRSALRGGNRSFTRVAVIDVRKAWVLEQHIYDASGRLVASSIAREHRFLPEAGVSVPQKLEVRIPAADFSLSIDVGSVTVNQPLDNPALWSMPTMAGYPQIDLGAGGVSANPPAMGRQLMAADWSGPGPLVTVATPDVPFPPLPAPPASLPVAAASGAPPMAGAATSAGGMGLDAASREPRMGRLPTGGQPTALPDALR
jgi:hypothetical protein